MTAEEHLAAFLESLGMDLGESESSRTPERVTQLFTDLFASIGEDAPKMSKFEVETQDFISVEAIPFRSLCVHHLVPFFGTVDIAIAPNKLAAGFGSFSRIVDFVSRKPQLQERLTSELADILEEELSPRGVFVRTRARQMCVELRGKDSSTFSVVVARGLFENLRVDALFSDADRPKT